MYEVVTHTCPTCGFQWAQREDTNDEWFKLTTHSELCGACLKVFYERLKKESEILLGGSGDNE